VFPNRPLTKSSRMPRPASRALAGTIAGLALAALSSALPVSAAQAATATTCPSTTLVQPFVTYADKGYYSLVAGGSFEGSMAGWGLHGGAKVVAGGEPSAVGGSLGADSLALPAGAYALSPFTCVEPNDRTFRIFARSEGSTATIVASVVYSTLLGNVAVPVGTVVLKSGWAPSPIMHTGAVLATAISGGVAHVSLEFTTIIGTARIDDVYLDPRMR
jgi:hypothetical protein